MWEAKSIINATTHYSHKKQCGAALTTTCVMLSGRVLMVSPPPGTALRILAWPEDDRWALWGSLSPPVDSSCCCETLYQLSVQNNENQVSMLCWSCDDIRSFFYANWCNSNSKSTNSHTLVLIWEEEKAHPGSSTTHRQCHSDWCLQLWLSHQPLSQMRNDCFFWYCQC